MIRPTQKLFVMWSDPKADTRYIVGFLWQDRSAFAFAYGAEVEAAMTRGFALLPEFQQLRTEDAPYLSKYLFSTFAQRVPSPRRPDFGKLMESWAVSNTDDQLEVLARSGGLQVTDRLELSEFRPVDDQLYEPLVIRMAGSRYYDMSQPFLCSGNALRLERDVANQHDPNATRLMLGTTQVGWVPHQYAALCARLLLRGVAINAVALLPAVFPGKGQRWFVRLSRNARQ